MMAVAVPANYSGLRGEYGPGMVTRIGPAKPFRMFLREWRQHRGLTQQQLADRMMIDDTGRSADKGQISRWENQTRGITLEVQSALATALNIEIADLFRDPAQPSADELLRRASPELKRQAFAVIETLLRTGTHG